MTFGRPFARRLVRPLNQPWVGTGDGGGAPTLPEEFVLRMQTTTASESITLPMTGNNDLEINWGDGTIETITTDSPSHTYTVAGTYDISITGTTDRFAFANGGDKDKLLAVLSGGTNFVAGALDEAFFGCANVETIDLSGLDTSNVTDMSFMFGSCSNLDTLDVTGFETLNVEDMTAMFFNCSSLTTLDLTSFNTSKVESMNTMFRECSGLTTLNLTGFDTSSVTNMSSMFRECSDLTTLDLTSFDTSSVTNMSFMFRECSDLTTLDVTSFNTSSVTNMSFMFRDCSSLDTLDVTGFDTSDVANMSFMFTGCSSLTSDPGIVNFAVGALTNATDMCSGANAMLSESEYNAILVAWEAQTVSDNVSVHFGDAVYSGAGATARTALVNDHSWTITDGGAA